MRLNTHRGMVREIIVSGVLLVFSLVVLFVLIPGQIEQSAEYDVASLSPAYFPTLAVIIILGLNVFLIIGHIRRLGKGLAPIDHEEDALTAKEEWRVAGAMAISVVYYLLLDALGFWIINTLGVTALIALQEKRRVWKHVLVAFATTTCVYLFFHYVMRVYFPMGAIFE